MCGIAGFLDLNSRTSAENAEAVARRMADAVAYRGPDESDVWCDAGSGIALGHRRLSIVDLSATGHQPMHSACGRYVISYNGEIYNAAALRPELEAAGVPFRGHSDTEVMLAGFAVWGVVPTLSRLAGMFAFALWDRGERCLYLVRDRLGIKPMYWFCRNGHLVFGSELKALHAHPEAHFEIDRDAVTSFLRFGYVPSPQSIYRDVQKLSPGHVLRVSAALPAPEIETYWSLDHVVAQGRAAPFAGSDEDAASELERLLTDVVGEHMVSDVPLGALLSGGIDSSAVTALMQAQSNRPVRTFSIGFAEQSYNEADHAKAVAAHLGTDHHELYVTAADALAVVPRLPDFYDEPFADASQIPTCLVSALSRRHVTVALSGDGGDEVFAGYTRYLTALGLRQRLQNAPPALRQLSGKILGGIPAPALDWLSSMLPQKYRPSHAGDRLHKLALVLNESDDGYYRRLVSQWWQPECLVPGGHERQGLAFDDRVKDRVPDLVDRMQYLDTRTYLPDDILTKVDRASMAVSLEARVPLLDHRVVEFAWRLPQRLKIRAGQGKWLLRQVLYRHVPQTLIDRPKAGFSVPIDEWLRGPLRDWAEELLRPEQLSADGLLDPGPIRQRWDDHLQRRANWHYPLWAVLMLQAWRERWRATAR